MFQERNLLKSKGDAMKDTRFEPLPDDPIGRIRRFVRDLAYGAANRLWLTGFVVNGVDGEYLISAHGNFEHTRNFDEYVQKVWEGFSQPYDIMVSMGYFNDGILTNKAFALLEEPIPASIFISYRRRESSALALLIVARMKEHGLSPFLDMHPSRDSEGNALTYGEDWAMELREVIEAREYFILLVGPSTFADQSYVPTELKLALSSEKSKRIIPVWHNGFNPEEHLPLYLPSELKAEVEKNNAIKVEAENPKQYNASLDELLGVFGITP
jgi:hypothetical protein